MTTLFKLLAVSFLFSLEGCSSFSLHDFNGGVILPYSGDCFQIGVVTRQETRTPAPQCQAMVSRAVFLTSADWKILRADIQTNCQFAQCRQLVGQFDQLFLTIDQDLDLIPWR